MQWEMGDAAKVAEFAELNRNPLYCLQDVDLLHLAALPALHSLDLVNIAQLTGRVLPVLACIDSLRRLWLRQCPGIAASDVAELSQANSARRALDSEHRRSQSVQLLDSLRLEECAQLPASQRAGLRLQLSEWSALKLLHTGPASDASAVPRISAFPHLPSTLLTRQWRLGVRADSAAEFPAAVYPVAFLYSQQPLPAPSPVSPPPSTVVEEESWPFARRSPGVAEMAWLCGRLLLDGAGHLRRRCCPCCKRPRAPSKALVGLLFLGSILLPFLVSLVSVVVGLCAGGSVDFLHSARIIELCLWPFHLYIDLAYFRRHRWLGSVFNYQTRLSQRRHAKGGAMDVDGMDEGGALAGWTATSLSKCLYFWAIVSIYCWGLGYNMAVFGGLAVWHRGSSTDSGQSSNTMSSSNSSSSSSSSSTSAAFSL